jgi:hypothetical protein
MSLRYVDFVSIVIFVYVSLNYNLTKLTFTEYM